MILAPSRLRFLRSTLCAASAILLANFPAQAETIGKPMFGAWGSRHSTSLPGSSPATISTATSTKGGWSRPKSPSACR